MLSAPAELITSDGDYPIAVLGEGRLVSEHPAFSEMVGLDHLVYATLHDSLAYGNPAFWFGETRKLMPNIEGFDETAERTVILDIGGAILRRVDVFWGNLSIDNTGLSRYHFSEPEAHDNDGKLLIIPDGYN